MAGTADMWTWIYIGAAIIAVAALLVCIVVDLPEDVADKKCRYED